MMSSVSATYGSLVCSSKRCRASQRSHQRSFRCKAEADDEGLSIAQRFGQSAVGLLSVAALSLGVAPGPPELMVPPAEAGLISRDPIKNARAILRYALPIDNKPIRQIQVALENISEEVRIPGRRSYGVILGVGRECGRILNDKKDKIIGGLAPNKKEIGLANIEKLEAALPSLKDAVATEDKNEIIYKQQELLEYVGVIEESMLKEFPFQIPSEYNNLPQLKGRATLEMKVNLLSSARPDKEQILIIVADGLNAPISAGDFVDLAAKGFYDGMEIQRADGFVVQTGRPSNGEYYVDPKTGQDRKIPFEVRVEGDKEPIYEETLEDLGRFNDQPVLPFNAYGTLAMARAEFENNSASSQVFFLLKESELTPSSSNLLDGRYAVFGYVVDGQDLLGDMKVGDKIEYLKVVNGLENLVTPA